MKTEEEIIEGVKEIISNNANLPIKFKTLSNKLDLDKNSEKILSKVIDDLAANYTIIKVRENFISRRCRKKQLSIWHISVQEHLKR